MVGWNENRSIIWTMTCSLQHFRKSAVILSAPAAFPVGKERRAARISEHRKGGGVSVAVCAGDEGETVCVLKSFVKNVSISFSIDAFDVILVPVLEDLRQGIMFLYSLISLATLFRLLCCTAAIIRRD